MLSLCGTKKTKISRKTNLWFIPVFRDTTKRNHETEIAKMGGSLTCVMYFRIQTVYITNIYLYYYICHSVSFIDRFIYFIPKN